METFLRHNITKLFLLLLLATAGKAKAQGYQSYFGADSTQLNVYLQGIDYDETFTLNINTTDSSFVNGHYYRRGLQRFNNGFYSDPNYYYFREDTVTGKLYRYIPMIDEELLLCDMSLQVGDTFYFNTSGGANLSIVDHISFENGKKVICFSGWYYYWEFHEGIFPNYLPIGFPGPSYEYDLDISESYLLCEYKNGEQVFDNPNFNNCIEHLESINEKNTNSIKIYPTSASFTENIQIETSDPISDIVLFDLYGKENPVFVDKVSLCHWNLTVQNGVSGVYIIKITTKKGISFEKIFISNH
ncbi:MAG: T9SS type A sorting domain-containing protein [Bacteroidales bacterium]|nr:T9SS type A sorting domain-containing protein [Bacteroidales bacterium]